MEIILTVWLCLVLSPVVLWFGYSLTGFWTRTEQSYSLLYKLQNLKYRWLADDFNRGLTTEGVCCSWLLVDAIVFGFLSMLLIAVQKHFGFEVILWGLLVLLLLIAPRYVLDITKSIRYNFKTRDSDRLKELESEIEKIKAKVK